jgi:prepilin-type N-terminal cleavage/methylation domain-containing protein
MPRVSLHFPTTRSRAPRHRAFTLIELLLAMVVVAILIPVLYNAMRVSFTSKTAAETALEPPRTAEAAMDVVRNDLADAMPPTGTVVSEFIGIAGTDERGRDASDVQFFTTADAPLDATGLVNTDISFVELCVVDAPNGDHVLVRKVYRDAITLMQNGGTTSNMTPDVEVICRGVGGFSVRYFDGLNWGENWDTTQTEFNNELPAAVQLILTLDRPTGATKNPDGTASFRYTRIIPLSCSYAPFDTTMSTGFTETQ